MSFILILTPRENLPQTVSFSDAYLSFFSLVKKFEESSDLRPKLVRASFEENRIELQFDTEGEINKGHVTSYFSKPLYDQGWGVQGKEHAVFSMQVYELTQVV